MATMLRQFKLTRIYFSCKSQILWAFPFNRLSFSKDIECLFWKSHYFTKKANSLQTSTSTFWCDNCLFIWQYLQCKDNL